MIPFEVRGDFVLKVSLAQVSVHADRSFFSFEAIQTTTQRTIIVSQMAGWRFCRRTRIFGVTFPNSCLRLTTIEATNDRLLCHRNHPEETVGVVAPVGSRQTGNPINQVTAGL